jgi:hypothetical protein
MCDDETESKAACRNNAKEASPNPREKVKKSIVCEHLEISLLKWLDAIASMDKTMAEREDL